MRFLAQTKGRREKERERKRNGKEEEGKEKGKGELEVKLWQKRKKSLSICICPTLGARRGPSKHLPCLLYLLLLWRAACPRSERSVGGPARIALMLDFGASRPVCKRALRAGGRLVILSRMVTHTVTSMPKTAKMRMCSAAS